MRRPGLHHGLPTPAPSDLVDVVANALAAGLRGGAEPQDSAACVADGVDGEPVVLGRGSGGAVFPPAQECLVPPGLVVSSAWGTRRVVGLLSAARALLGCERVHWCAVDAYVAPL